MNNPVKNAFVVGTGRCGTTWLAQMLNSHSEICVPPEIQLLFEYSDNGSRLLEEFSQAGPSGLTGDRIATVIEQGCPHKLEMFFDYSEFCRRKDTPKSRLVDFVAAFYSAIAKSHGKTWLIEQTPWYGSRLDLLTSFFPEAKIIHMVRDGRDVALSFSRTPWWHTSPQLNLARWQREIKKITLDAAFYLDAKSYLEVRYEDLVANTKCEIQRICEFLSVEFDPAMLDPKSFVDYDRFCKFDMQQVSSQAYTAWRERKDAAFFSENVQAWRREGDLFHPPLPDEIVYWLTRYGYEVGSEKPDELSTVRSHLDYSFTALEPLNLSQAEQIHTLESLLQKRVEHTELVTTDWAARGVQIDHLAQSINTLEGELNKFRSSWHGVLGRSVGKIRQRLF